MEGTVCGGEAGEGSVCDSCQRRAEAVSKDAGPEKKNEDIENDPGLLSPVGPAPLCPKCNEPVDSQMTTAEYYGPKGAPWFCSQCRRWAHHSCPKPRPLGGRCPLCGERMRATSDFFCTSCMDWVLVKKGSSWPEFSCVKCGNATSIGHRSLGSMISGELFGKRAERTPIAKGQSEARPSQTGSSSARTSNGLPFALIAAAAGGWFLMGHKAGFHGSDALIIIVGAIVVGLVSASLLKDVGRR